MEQEGSITRRALLRRGAALSAAAIAGRGVYSALDGFAAPARASAATTSRRQEQYLIDSLEVILDNSTPVVIPPVYNDVFTAKLAPDRTWNKTTLVAAQKRLESALARVESPYSSTAAGLTIVVAWGLPYFRAVVPGPWQAKAPRDLVLPPLSDGQREFAVLDAVCFPSDPADVVLEDNHVAFKIRSDSSAIVQSVETQLFADASSPAYVGDLLQLTSKRIGFAGRGFNKPSVARGLALQAGVAAAQSIPDRAQLTMGFTSTQPAALGPDNIVSFETLPGMTNQFPSGYFAHGCAMHLSHLYLDLDLWYGRTYGQRVGRMFSPTTSVPADGTVTIPNGPPGATLDQVKADAAAGRAGHNSLLQTATRLKADVTDNYGRRRTKGTAIPVREDFNTLDAPFTWYRDGTGAVAMPRADQPGLHFAVFVPTSSRFHVARQAMDGVLPDGTDLRPQFGPNPDEQIGINSSMRATHRQNFLVPPRSHRSFPLAELL